MLCVLRLLWASLIRGGPNLDIGNVCHALVEKGLEGGNPLQCA